MALRYHVSTYRPATCSNKECDNYGKIISTDTVDVLAAEVGESWRTFCSCGDGAGWTLDSIESDPTIQIDEVIIKLKIQIHFEPEPIDIPVGNGITGPYWKHDCDRCLYLGSRRIDDSCYDFYYCEIKDSGVSPYTGIIREGNDPDNNSSYLQRSIMEWDAGDPNDVCSILKSLILTVA